ncbi:DUF2235 domain-containing protein (plasmid) [Cupriavidus pauculus]|uniref:DUF2235 domain-containing protein n=2 Tax=Cupriavidus pauculus TaxID=82633 RepID=A0A3G8HAF9_9BURK|nr:DUF2235 domain-containing protein [Cupriavidus pauculus]
MARNLAVFFDGTWNEPNDRTNVYELYKSALECDDQEVRYIEGVGSQGGGIWAAMDKFAGGAFGAGLSANIREGYRWLSQRFRPGDKIFLFGFSRGAYGARSLSGMIRNCGLLMDPNEDRVGEAYSLYRDEGTPESEHAQSFRTKFSFETDIHFLGVWDTVGSLGIPVGTLKIPGFSNYYQFHDTELSNYVRNAFHALATNEFRAPYAPTYWTRRPESGGRPSHLSVEQRWFIGAHADVGGGYIDGCLQTLPAAWLQWKAWNCGLHFNPAVEVARDYDAASPHDSYTEFSKKVPFHIDKAARAWEPGMPLNLTCDRRLHQKLVDSEFLKEYPELRARLLELPLAEAIPEQLHKSG